MPLWWFCGISSALLLKYFYFIILYDIIKICHAQITDTDALQKMVQNLLLTIYITTADHYRTNEPIPWLSAWLVYVLCVYYCHVIVCNVICSYCHSRHHLTITSRLILITNTSNILTASLTRVIVGKSMGTSQLSIHDGGKWPSSVGWT